MTPDYSALTSKPLDLETAERTVRDGVLAIGARLLEAAVAARGAGKSGARHGCACGTAARFEGE